MQTQSFPPPVFVLGAPTVPAQTLAAALGAGPASAALPELNLELMTTVDVFQREMTGIRTPQTHGLLRALSHLLAGEQTAPGIEMARRWLTRRAYMTTGMVAHEIAAHVAPRRMVVPVTAAIFDRPSLRRLSQTFPQAAFVHLTVHPLAYGRQLLADPIGPAALQLSGALDESLDPPLPDPQELWLMTETAAEAFLADLPPERAICQRLEDLLADPKAALAALAGRLDLPADAQSVAAMMRPEGSVFAGVGPMGAHLPGTIRSLADHAAALPAPEDLSTPLPWRPDGAPLRDAVRDRAVALGYG